ncbi:outer dynein arm-docking complex subunit 3-like [Mya arenaria]|uniref:outer dynein arm-docking complex subunit 3-like n=1 Tax=Mya arenaria TaxID=6604 RepID=UPI0022E349DD|nr:outer dynein arm-docking complex subunit 3-like [Mya arenaria]
MPGTNKAEITPNGWTLAEMVEETKGKLHLKERDANAFYESSEVKKMTNEELISRMRKENKQKRIELARCICGDETVIHSAFHHRKEELLSMQRFTPEKAIIVMDEKVCDANNKLNSVLHQKAKKQATLAELQSELDHMSFMNTTDSNDSTEKEIRRIQNEMDKALIKVGAACNITCRYEAIMDSLQKEVRNYPAILDNLENQVKKSTEEQEELQRMTEKAIKAGEDARRDLHTMEREMYQAKRARDQQLNEMKKEVDKRKEVHDRSDKRQKIALISDSSDSRQAKLLVLKAERQEKVLTLEDAFERIMIATHVSDMEDIIYRLENQDNTYRQLSQMEKEKTVKRNMLADELTKQKAVFQELKFTSEGHVQRGCKAVEDMAGYLKYEENRRNTAVENYQRNNKLHINLQSGTTTLLEKLKEVRLKPPFHNFAAGDPIEDLKQCGRKLDLVLTNLGLKKNDQSQIHKVESEKLHEYLEAKIPPDNIRIRIDTADDSDEDDFHFDHDQENDGFTSREDIKRQGQDILNSKLKPKKKKARKRNN